MYVYTKHIGNAVPFVGAFGFAYTDIPTDVLRQCILDMTPLRRWHGLRPKQCFLKFEKIKNHLNTMYGNSVSRY